MALKNTQVTDNNSSNQSNQSSRLNTNATKLTNLFNPQVIGDMINTKLVNAIKFSPLCRIDNTLVGRPGSTITLPSFTYIGDATIVSEGADIPISKLTASTVEKTIYKVGKGVQITDEAVLSGYGDPLGEAVKQIQIAIASKIDNDILGILSGIDGNMTHPCTGRVTANDIADALVKFGEDIEGEKVLLCSPETYAGLRKAAGWCPASEIAAQLIIRGTVGMIHGCQVVISNKLSTPKTAYIVKPGALALYMKRDILVETDRDIINKSTVITADKHFVGYLYDASKAIKLTETVTGP